MWTCTKSITLVCTAMLSCVALAPAFAQASPSPFTWATRYDTSGRIAGTIAPDPDGPDPLRHAAIRTSYNPAGRVTKVEKGELAAWQSEAVSPSNWTGFTVLHVVETQYDADGRKVKETMSGVASEASGPPLLYAVTEQNYDANGRPKCTAVRMNPDTWATPLPDTCVPGAVHPTYGADRIVKSVYDDAGQQVQSWEGVGTADAAAEATRDYTPNGKLRFLIDANGNRNEMRYDEFDRLQCWILPSAAGPANFNPATQATALASAGSVNGDCVASGDFEYYGYDANGNRTSLRNRAGETLGYGYDALDRMILKDRPGSEPDIVYTYDLRGLQRSATFPSTGEAVTNLFDGFGRLVSSTNNTGGLSLTLSYEWDADGNRTRVTHPADNVSGTGPAFFAAYDYDGLGRVIAVRENGAQSGTGVTATYVYDRLGRRLSLTRGNGAVTTYRYDSGSRLERLKIDLPGAPDHHRITLAYNPASQIVSRTATNDLYAYVPSNGTSVSTANGRNQLTGVDGVPMSHDARGNMTADATRTYGFTSENLMTSLTLPTPVVLTYDPLLRLRSAGSPPFTPTVYLMDPAAGERDAWVGEYYQGNLAGHTIFGAGPDEPLLMVGKTGAHDFLLADERGSILARTGPDGAIRATVRYDEYGRSTGGAGRYGYAGLPTLASLYYARARIYDPLSGRFLQPDPIGYDDQINLYAYVGNDPMNQIDPDGKQIINPMRGAAYIWDKLSPSDKEIIAKGVEVVGIIWDVGTIATGIGTGPEGIAAGKTASTSIRQSIQGQLALRAQLIGQQIGRGHAWAQHGSEFKSIGIRTRVQFERYIERTVAQAKDVRTTRDGRQFYIDHENRAVVIRDSKNEGTAFRPKDWDNYITRNVPKL